MTEHLTESAGDTTGGVGRDVSLAPCAAPDCRQMEAASLPTAEVSAGPALEPGVARSFPPVGPVPLSTADFYPRYAVGKPGADKWNAARLELALVDASGAATPKVFDPVQALVVGSGAASDLRISDPGVAPVHCALDVSEGRLSVSPVGAGKVVLLNGRTLDGPATVEVGDQIRIGGTLLRVDGLSAASGLKELSASPDSPPALFSRLWWKDDLVDADALGRGALTIGEGVKARYLVPGIAGVVEVARVVGNAALVSVPGEGERRELKVGQGLRLPMGDFCLDLFFGPSFQRVSGVERSLDGTFAAFALLLFALAALAVWNLETYVVDEKAFEDEFFGNPQKLARWVAYLKPPQTPAAARPADKLDTADEDEAPDADGKAKGDESLKPGKPGKPGRPGAPSRKKVMKAGLLGALSGLGQGGGTASVFGGGGAFGAQIDAALGQMDGKAAGAPGPGEGAMGFGLRGLPGGDGSGLGIGTLGAGGGAGGEGGEGGEGGQGGGGRGRVKREAAVRRAVPGKSVMAGSCEREVVGGVISKNSRQVLACYETQLIRNPDLSGKVTVKFTIESNGRVGDVEIAESTLSDKGVEDCLKKRIQRWRFPEPKGGGICVVNYPWMFQQAGGGK